MSLMNQEALLSVRVAHHLLLRDLRYFCVLVPLYDVLHAVALEALAELAEKSRRVK
jgi:hypothetical protein